MLETRLLSRDGLRAKRVRLLEVTAQGIVEVTIDGDRKKFYLISGKPMGNFSTKMRPLWRLHPDSIPALKELRKQAWLAEDA